MTGVLRSAWRLVGGLGPLEALPAELVAEVHSALVGLGAGLTDVEEAAGQLVGGERGVAVD